MSLNENTTLTDGTPVPEDGSYRELKSNGQQKGYVVLNDEERAKGFCRPLRFSYRHVGEGPKYPTRPLTDEEKLAHGPGYDVFEDYPPERSPLVGRAWSSSELTTRCGAVTSMSRSIAETYARDPSFYGSTFCTGCGKHFPVAEFVWEGTNERVGS